MMTSHYSHGGRGWNMKLREAVTLLEDAYRRTNLSYYLSYEGLAQEECEERKVSNSAEHLKKGWWFQEPVSEP